MLCIARTLAVEPQVILMDEPCSALDPIATYRIEELMGQLKAQYTIAVVTHNMQQASRVSDFTAFLLAGEDRTGRLVEYGPTARIFTTPSDPRTEVTSLAGSGRSARWPIPSIFPDQKCAAR